MILVLAAKSYVDLMGVDGRLHCERQQGIRHNEGGSFTDLGLVIYDGYEYYASLYRPPMPLYDTWD